MPYRDSTANTSAAPPADASLTPEEQVRKRADEKFDAEHPVASQFLAFRQGAQNLIPFGNALEAATLPGGSRKEISQEQQRLHEQHGTEELAGTGAGIVGSFLAGGPAAGAASVVKAVAKNVAMVPVYKLGETVSAAMRDRFPMFDPLRVEQIEHALMPDWDWLKVGALTAGLHLAPEIVAKMSGPIDRMLQSKAATAAERQAGKLYPDAAFKLSRSSEDVGRQALNEGLLKEPLKIKGKLAFYGASLEDIAKRTPVDMALQEKMAVELEKIVQKWGQATGIKNELRAIQEQSVALTQRAQDGHQLEKIIQKFDNIEGDAEILGDAKQAMRTIFADHIGTLDPKEGAAYRDAVAQYRTYKRMLKETAAGAEKQATSADVAWTLAAPGVTAGAAAAGGYAAEGPGAAAAAAAAAMAMKASGKTSMAGKNYAVLLDRFSKNPPLATAERQAGKLLKGLLGSPEGAFTLFGDKPRDLDEYYGEVEQTIRACQSQPDKYAEALAHKLWFLPQHERDAVIMNTMHKIQATANDLPKATGPISITGQPTTGPTDRQKREALTRMECRHDPYKALASGRPDLIAEAEKCFPETVREARKKLVELCATKPEKIPYSTMRQISVILGGVSSATQDPLIGAQLQQCLQNSRQAQSNQGQMDSARQSLATQKNAKATMSRAQNLSNAMNEK
jgi:hypothetical protein